jgi:curli biogenesis system outer membrane secretion channel CsgG
VASRLITWFLGTWLILVPPAAWPSDLSALPQELAAALAADLRDRPARRVAVTDLPDLAGTVSDLGRYLAERLTTRLSQTPGFNVVERRRIAAVLAELRLELSDLFRADGARQLGRALGAEAIVVGTLSDLGSHVDVDVRVIDAETGAVLAGAEGTVRKVPDVEDLLGRARVSPPAPRSSP